MIGRSIFDSQIFLNLSASTNFFVIFKGKDLIILFFKNAFVNSLDNLFRDLLIMLRYIYHKLIETILNEILRKL